MIDFRSKRARQVAAIVFALAVLPTLWFGVRTYGSFLLLRSAYELGAPQVSNVRGWMTLRYVSTAYRVPADALLARLNQPSSTDLDASIRSLGEKAGMDPFDYVLRVQQAIAAAASQDAAPVGRPESSGWFGFDTGAILSALLIYGYPALALTLFLGALGLPVPTGLATTLAGSLAGRGQLDWLAAGMIAVAASAIGDVIGYAIGRWLGEEFLERRGRWLGFTQSRRARIQALFDRWGGLTVLITRTLVSHLSSVVSLLAGMSGYRFLGFAAFAFLGRIAWTAAYLGLGYGVGHDIEAASTFLANLTALLVSLLILVISGLIASGRVRYGESSVS